MSKKRNENDAGCPPKGKAVLTRRGFIGVSGGTIAAVGIASGAGVLLNPSTASAQVTGETTVKWGFAIDLRKCSGCEACSVACKSQNNVPLGVFRSNVKLLERGDYAAGTVKQYSLPWLCNHCEAPSCVDVCPIPEVPAVLVMPDGTEVGYQKKGTYKRPDGVVLIDQDRCNGCGLCVVSCPYQVRFINPDVMVTTSEEPDTSGPNVADKCDLCVSRLDQGIAPSCVQTCPADARVIGNLLDPSSEISMLLDANAANVEGQYTRYNTEPNVFYVMSDAAVTADAISDDGVDARSRKAALGG